jgi:dUTP pyrophosphatase
MSNAPDLRVKINIPGTPLPSRAYPTDSGFDLCAMHFDKIYLLPGENTTEEAVVIDKDKQALIIEPGQRALVNTGISATVGAGWEIQVRPRSGLALKQGLTVLNAPGTIDEAYIGPICVILINHSNSNQTVKIGDRIAQMVVCPVGLSNVLVVEELATTARNDGGFGSTGI